MRTPFIPWTDTLPVQAAQSQHAAWFIIGCLEREHRLNVEALASYWPEVLRAWAGGYGAHAQAADDAAPRRLQSR